MLFRSVAWQPGACGGLGGQLLAGEVVLERGEEVTDDGHAPGLPKNLLSLLAVHVLHVRVVFGEAKDPGVGGRDKWFSWWNAGPGGGGHDPSRDHVA